MENKTPVSREAASLGATIRKRRQNMKLTQKSLAVSASSGEVTLDQGDVSRIEAGLRLPSIPQLAAIAAVLRTTPSRLLGTSHG